MPIFEFRCEDCQNVFELLALNRDEQLEAQCPACGGQTLSRVLSTCASVMGSAPSSGQAGGPSVQNRSCGKESSCTTLTLPGHTR